MFFREGYFPNHSLFFKYPQLVYGLLQTKNNFVGFLNRI